MCSRKFFSKQHQWDWPTLPTMWTRTIHCYYDQLNNVTFSSNFSSSIKYLFFKCSRHEHIFFLARFSVTIFIYLYTWENLPEFYVTNVFAEKLAPRFLCGKEKISYVKFLFVCTTRHRKFATYSDVGNGFFSFVSTVHNFFCWIGKQVFNITFAVFIHYQLSLSQRTCHRKYVCVY